MTKHRAGSGGMTLIEVLFTLLIVSMIAGILFVMIVKSKTAWQTSATRTASRQDLQVAVHRMTGELRNSNISYVTDGSAANLRAFSFISAYDKNGNCVTDSTGNLVWQKYVIYYIPAKSTKLLRKEVYKDFVTDPTVLVPLTTAGLAAQLDGTGKLLSTSAVSLKLTPSADGKSKGVLSLGTEAENRHGRLDRQTREITVNFYN